MINEKSVCRTFIISLNLKSLLCMGIDVRMGYGADSGV